MTSHWRLVQSIYEAQVEVEPDGDTHVPWMIFVGCVYKTIPIIHAPFEELFPD